MLQCLKVITKKYDSSSSPASKIIFPLKMSSVGVRTLVGGFVSPTYHYPQGIVYLLLELSHNSQDPGGGRGLIYYWLAAI